MNLYLVGYRGTGKTTVAAALAETLARDWVDVDAEIERQSGKSIRELFERDGEPAFRDWETRVIAAFAAQEHLIVSLGGGAILRAENRAALASTGQVVWLQALPETIWRRIASDPSTAGRRPHLTALGGLEEIKTVLAERTPLYAALAQLAIDTEGKSPESIAGEIVAALALRSG